MQRVSGNPLRILGLDRHLVHGEPRYAPDALHARGVACVRGEDAADVRRADRKGHERSGQDFADSFADNQYPCVLVAFESEAPSLYPTC